MEHKQSFFSWILNGIKSFFTKDIGTKIIALLFAMLLWGYVLTDLNPYRTKALENISVSFDGEAELLAKGMCIRGDRGEILKPISAQVRTQLTNYADLNSNAVNAIVSLNNISVPGEYKLPIRANVASYTSSGTVQSVSPATVTVEIDKLVSKTVPVSCETIGELPAGYWADMENLTYTSKVDIQGAKTDIAQINRAVCTVDLTDRIATVFGTFDLTLYDFDDKVIDSGIAVGTIPSTTVRIPVYPIKEVPVNWKDSVIGIDKLAANYEISSVAVTPEKVRLVGTQAALDETESVCFEPVTISGSSEPVKFESQLIIPENVRNLDAENVTVTVDIQESISKLEFEDLKIEVTGLDKNLEAKITPGTVHMILEGRTSLLSIIKRSDVKVDVDVTGLEAGIYELPLTFYVRSDDMTAELIFTPSEETVAVVIVEK